MDLVGLRDTCIKRGWLDHAREYLDPVLRSRDSDLSKRVLGFTSKGLSDLECDLNEGRHWRSYRWFDQQMRNGARRHELINALFDWFKEKKSPAALAVVGNILSNEGNRAELIRLEEVTSGMPETAENLSEIQFNIFRRTLN
jgi:hypothetical protein